LCAFITFSAETNTERGGCVCPIILMFHI
jgi:hypothetical protein